MAFNPTNNPLLPPNTARLSNGITYILESTGFAQRAVEILADGTRGRVGPESASEIFVLFDEMYTSNAYPPGTGPTVEVNIPVEPTPPPPPPPPKKVEEKREQEEQLKKNKDERASLSKTDTEVINNAVTEDQKPQGAAKLPSLFLKQGKKLSKFIIPLISEFLQEYGVNQLEQELKNNTFSLEELKEKFCPANLQNIIQKRNNAVDYLNKTGDRLDSLSITVDFGSDFASLIQGLIITIKTVKTTVNTTLSFIPVGIPGIVPSSINTAGDIADKLTFKEDGTPNLPPLKISASQVSPAIASVQATILKCVELLGKLDILINLCSPPDTTLPPLTSISDSIKKTSQVDFLAGNSLNGTTYKGFILEIETRPFTDRVNESRAVGKNNSEIIMTATEYSFASDPQVLITELKFIIDRDDLKAY